MFGQTSKALAEVGFRVVLAITLAIPVLVMNTLTAQADTEVGGPIISDTIWTTTNSPYVVIENVEVWEGVTLTIEPGVTVKFDSGKKLQVNGELIARGISGTAGGQITFTSNQSDPAPGDWGNIEFTSTAITTTMDAEGHYVSGSILQYCVVEYAGGYYPHIVSSAIYAHSLLIDHCTVRSNNSRGIYNIGTVNHSARITNNIITSNSKGGRYSDSSGGGIYVSFGVVTGNIVSDNASGSSYFTSNGGGIYAINSVVNDNIVTGNSVYSGNSVHGGGIYAPEGTVNGNTVSGNWAFSWGSASGGGIYVPDGMVSNNVVIGNSVISDADYARGGGISAVGSTLSGNIVSGNSVTNGILYSLPQGQGYGGGIYAGGGEVLANTITGNIVFADDPKGAGAYVIGSGDFLYNTVVGNSGPLTQTVGGLAVDGTPQVHYNNLYGNAPYDVTVISSSDISGTYNYWGTASSVDISEQIYDWYDEGNRGKFLYTPYLQDPSPDAPFPPPTGLTADFQDESTTLSWDAHPGFTTGYGYKVYYDSDSSIPPYEGTGLNEGDSPIDVGDQITYTLTGLDPSKDCYVTITAYDNEGHESWYSNVEWREGGYWVYLTIVLRQ